MFAFCGRTVLISMYWSLNCKKVTVKKTYLFHREKKKKEASYDQALKDVGVKDDLLVRQAHDAKVKGVGRVLKLVVECLLFLLQARLLQDLWDLPALVAWIRDAHAQMAVALVQHLQLERRNVRTKLGVEATAQHQRSHDSLCRLGHAAQNKAGETKWHIGTAKKTYLVAA